MDQKAIVYESVMKNAKDYPDDWPDNVLEVLDWLNQQT